MKKSLISICIPTYQRPDLIQQALESCFAQDYDPIEIIISDDSQDNRTEDLIRELQSNCQYKIRYYHNHQPLGQAGNVNQLFELAEGEKLVLLHDDDLLSPHALRELSQCWQFNSAITAAFGRQGLISQEGTVLDSEELNRVYYRTDKYEGVQLSALESALVQQFPNDGYMVLTEIARKTQYRDESEVGTGCDFDFGIQLASVNGTFYFLNQETAQYRLTNLSVSTQGNPSYMYPYIKSLKVSQSVEWAKHIALTRLAPQVVHDYAIQGQRLEASKVYFSSYYGLQKWLSLQGFYHLLLILFPKLISFIVNPRKIKKNN